LQNAHLRHVRRLKAAARQALDREGEEVPRPSPAVISTARERSPAGKDEISRFARNDSWGGGVAFALPGTLGFLADSRK